MAAQAAAELGTKEPEQGENRAKDVLARCPPCMIVLVGLPGAGKSTFAHALEQLQHKHRGSDSPPVVVVNQDRLRRRKTCLRVARSALKDGASVVVDRCNFDVQQRAHWVKLARQFGVHAKRIVSVWLLTPLNVCHHRVQNRKGHPTLSPGHQARGVVIGVHRTFAAPTSAEGFGQLVVVGYKDTAKRNTVVRWLVQLMGGTIEADGGRLKEKEAAAAHVSRRAPSSLVPSSVVLRSCSRSAHQATLVTQSTSAARECVETSDDRNTEHDARAEQVARGSAGAQ